MKYSYASALVAATSSLHAAAYPGAAVQIAQNDLEASPVAPAKRYATPNPGFNAKEQYVSTKGKYKFVPPGPLDTRGPCPGLNAMANHGYLPHSGVGTIAEYIEGTYTAFGMGRDLGGFLAVYGAVFDGNLESYSLGGPSTDLPVLNGLLGTPTGLSGSHNKYENDASPIRGDLYTYGNDYLNQVELFQQFIDIHKGVPENKVNYGLEDIQEFRKSRFDNSIQTNPYFFNGPFSGAIASVAAYTFIYRYMANKSEEHPEGRLDRNTLKHFYSMTGKSGSYKYTPGHESFPDNWYKRALSDPYGIPFLTADGVEQILAHAEFASIGGNTGKVNTFTGIDPAQLTNGVFNAKNLLQGNNAFCYGFQLGLQTAPDLLEGIFTDVTPAMNMLSGVFKNAETAVGGCPQLESLQYDQFKKYPGWSKSYKGYKGHS